MSQMIIEPTKETALRQLIAKRAYEIWENQGQPHGCDINHWQAAEQEIMGCVKQVSDTPGASEVPDDPARLKQRAAARGRSTVP